MTQLHDASTRDQALVADNQATTFIQVPNCLPRSLSANARWLYCIYLQHANPKANYNRVWPSDQTVMEKFGGSVKLRTIRSYKQELVKAGLMRVHQRRYNSSTIYALRYIVVDARVIDTFAADAGQDRHATQCMSDMQHNAAGHAPDCSLTKLTELDQIELDQHAAAALLDNVIDDDEETNTDEKTDTVNANADVDDDLSDLHDDIRAVLAPCCQVDDVEYVISICPDRECAMHVLGMLRFANSPNTFWVRNAVPMLLEDCLAGIDIRGFLVDILVELGMRKRDAVTFRRKCADDRFLIHLIWKVESKIERGDIHTNAVAWMHNVLRRHLQGEEIDLSLPLASARR